MKFNLSKKDLEKVYSLINIKEDNIFVSDRINDFIQSDYRYFTKKDIKQLDDIALNVLSDTDEEYEILKEHLNKINKLDLSFYKNNPYSKNISIKKDIGSNIKLELKSYEPYELFISDDINVNEDNYLEKINLAYFDEKFDYLTLTKNNRIWMLITPNEINTMQKSIDEVEGKIVTFGLGLGYFQYMASLKDNVKEIYIIEKDQKVIDIFEKYLLPQFEHKEKIKIINQNAYNFFDNPKEKFDYAFIDLYHNPFDGLRFYLYFSSIENKFKSTKFLYWLNESLICLVRRCLITLVLEQLNNFDEKEYEESSTATDELINMLYKKFKDSTYNSYEEIYDLLSKENIKKIVKTL